MKKILSLILCLLMVISVLPVWGFAADTRTELDYFVGTSSNMEVPTLGAKRNPFVYIDFTVGSEAYISVIMGDWFRFDGENWVRYTETTFVNGQYRYRTQLRIDDENGEAYKLAEDNLLIVIDGENWTHETVHIFDTYSFTHIISPTYTVEGEDVKIDSVDITAKTPVVGNTPDFKLKLPDRAPYKVSESPSIAWYVDRVGGDELSSTSVFNKYRKYFLVVILSPIEGYVFDNPSATVNGNIAEVVPSGDEIIVVYKFGNALCPHKYDNVCDEDCNECGEVRTNAHKFDNGCDTDCNVCGKTRTVAPHTGGKATCVSAAKCSVCNEPYGSLGDHGYSSDCDKTCNYCGEERTVPDHVYDNEFDTHCNVCNEKRELVKLYVESVVNSKTITTHPNAVVTISAPRLRECIFTGWVVTEGTVVAIADPYSMETTVTMGNVNATIKPNYDDCTCKCHGNFLQKIIFMITNFIPKLFGRNRVCACGEKH